MLFSIIFIWFKDSLLLCSQHCAYDSLLPTFSRIKIHERENPLTGNNLHQREITFNLNHWILPAVWKMPLYLVTEFNNRHTILFDNQILRQWNYSAFTVTSFRCTSVVPQTYIYHSKSNILGKWYKKIVNGRRLTLSASWNTSHVIISFL